MSILRRSLSRVGQSVDRAMLLGISAMARRAQRKPDSDTISDAWKPYLDETLVSSHEKFFAPPQMSALTTEVIANENGLRVTDVAFRSGFVPFLPTARDRYLSFGEVQIARARLFQRAKPRPMIVCIHGMGGGDLALEQRIFPVKFLDRIGLDVALFVLPFHGRRTMEGARSGGFPGPDTERTNEAFGHSISDLRALALWLQEQGTPAIGVFGMSLGAYVSSLWATLDPLAFVFPMVPLARISDMVTRHDMHGTVRRSKRPREAIQRDVDLVLRVHSPLSRPLRANPEASLIIAAEGDAVCPPIHAMWLRDHFRDVPLYTMAGGHIAQFGRNDAFRAMARRLNSGGVIRRV